MVMHGGALDVAMAQYGGQFKDWLDLSTGINPYAYPVEVTNNGLSLADFAQLPQKSAHDDLIEVAKQYYQAPNANFTLANGTQYLIEHLPKIMPQSTIGILSPTYQEHEIAWQRAGHKVVKCDNLDEAKNCDHILIVNPNNPTGKIAKIDELTSLYQYVKNKGGYLILDEAFMDTVPDHSFTGFKKFDNLIIFKSFGKFFGLAGIRIGFLLASSKITSKLSADLPLWSIAGPSLKIAQLAMQDKAWIEGMISQLNFEMSEQVNMLEKYGFETIGQHGLFCLVKPPKKMSAYQWYEALCKNQILVRRFEHDQTILRLGLAPKSKFANFEDVIRKLSA